MSLEKAKSYIKSLFKFASGNYSISEKEFNDILKIASKPDWKYPEKGEFPENNRTVLLAFADSKYCNVGFFIKSDITDSYEGFMLLSRIDGAKPIENVIAWGELPIFDKA